MPVDISSAISSATDVASFIEQYASIIGDSMDENDVEHPDWESIKPAEGIEGINTVLNTSKSSIQSVAGQSYREMANFLREMGFESSKLAMRLEFVNNEPRWVSSCGIQPSIPNAAAEVPGGAANSEWRLEL